MSIAETDLAPYLNIDCDRIAENVGQMNPNATIIYLSVKSNGLSQWFDWVQNIVRHSQTELAI